LRSDKSDDPVMAKVTVMPMQRIFSHPAILVAALLGAAVAIFLMDRFLPDTLAVLLIDRDRETYPLTVQNVMWIVFVIGLAELMVRLRDTMSERGQLAQSWLPEDETTILQGPELRRVYAATRPATDPAAARRNRFLPRLIQRVVTQFQTNRSIEQANAILNSSMDLFMHEIDLRYSMVRYVVWVIPTLGFIGTVIGISLALAFAGQADLQDPLLLAELTKRLAVAFNTTLLALVMSAILVLILNAAGQYCLDNLINRLYVE
jgi:biopolymer transport protein ExbB/TolQ